MKNTDLFLFSSLCLASCGSLDDMAEPTAAAADIADVAACDEARVYATGIKCDWQSTYQRPAQVLCIDFAEHAFGGCTVREIDKPGDPLYREPCVAICPEGTRLMSDYAVKYLSTAYPAVLASQVASSK